MAAFALAAAAAVALAAGTQADLAAGETRCGQATCARHYYCSEFDQLCTPCDRVCNPASRSYVLPTCEKYCQDYIHDGRYVSPNEVDRLSKKVATMTVVATVALVIAALLLLERVIHKVRKHKHWLWRFTKRSASHASGKKVGSSDDPEAGQKAAEVAAAAATVLHLPTTPASSEESPPPPATLSRSVSRDVATPQTTSTPLSRPRHPSEDTTLDYAYDNPALAPSPSPGKDHQQQTGASPTLNGSAGGNHSMGATGTPVPSSATVGFGGRKESSF